MPFPALLLRPGTCEIVAANRSALLEGAEPGRPCYAGWQRFANPCPWCLAPKLWKSGEPQQRVIARDGRLLDTCWVPVDRELFLHYAIDVTDYRRMEASLRESEQLFRSTFEFAAAGIVHVGPGGQFLKVNPRYCEITGYPEDELLGMTFQQITHPDDQASDRTIFRRIFGGGVHTVTTEKRYVRKDGSVVWVNRIVGAVRSAGGNVKHLVVVVEEIGDRKRAMEALTQSRDQLRMLSTHIQDAVENEQKRMAREIHDILGQGLMGLKLDTSWVAENLDGSRSALTERMADMIESIDSTIQTVKRIATELRPVLLDDLGLGAAIEWQASDFQKRRGIACKVTVVPRDIELDPARSTALFRIFQEILENVVRHAGASKVSVRLVKAERDVTLTVRDNGIGIPPEKISDPMSLGLIGMRERAHAFGAEVGIKATRSGGTAVTARFPVDAGASR